MRIDSCNLDRVLLSQRLGRRIFYFVDFVFVRTFTLDYFSLTPSRWSPSTQTRSSGKIFVVVHPCPRVPEVTFPPEPVAPTVGPARDSTNGAYAGVSDDKYVGSIGSKFKYLRPASLPPAQRPFDTKRSDSLFF